LADELGAPTCQMIAGCTADAARVLVALANAVV